MGSSGKRVRALNLRLRAGGAQSFCAPMVLRGLHGAPPGIRRGASRSWGLNYKAVKARSDTLQEVGAGAWDRLAACCYRDVRDLRIRLHRLALWPVIQGCIANSALTGLSFPCLQLDLAGGMERGTAVLRPPLLNDMIVVPTRKIVGIEDPFLQSPDAPNYLAAAWRVRSLLVSPDGHRPNWEEIGLVVNSAIVRSQDQLHIHLGCLRPNIQSALTAIARQVPMGTWEKLSPFLSHVVFWGTRIAETDVERVAPFHLAAEALSDRVKDRRQLTIMVAGVRVSGVSQWLVLASYADWSNAWWPIDDKSLVDTRCPRPSL